jgi:hypothetical protein
MRELEAVGLAVGALFAAAFTPCAGAEIAGCQNVATVGDYGALCEPSPWIGNSAVVETVADLDTGWWVVLATVPADQDVRETVRKLENCALRPFSDFSSKFAGFAPGFQVVVDGAYATRSEAERVRSAASRCVPEAYVKWARYLGE